jgi:D-glucosaminate-6-phosphate ammonia-lyase
MYWDLARLGVDGVVNAAGRLTRLGGSVLSDDVVASMAAGGRVHVDVDILKQKAGEAIATMLGAEAAHVTPGAAAGIAIMTAAVVAGTDLGRIEQLPHVDWSPKEVLVPGGHLVHFGAPVAQMIRIGGGEPVPVGWVNMVTPEHLRSALVNGTPAAVLYVVSHHATQKGILTLGECSTLCREFSVPLLVDGAAETDLLRYASCGADLIAFSGGKAIRGPTSGIIIGRASLVAACRAQEAGIGRAMKIGKESILALLAALEAYLEEGAAQSAQWRERANELEAGLRGLPGTSTMLVEDEAGRDIARVGLRLDSAVIQAAAHDLASWLTEQSPPVYVRPHLLSNGIVLFDPRALSHEDVITVASHVRRFCQLKAPSTRE